MWSEVINFFGMKMGNLGGNMSGRALISRNQGKGRKFPRPCILTGLSTSQGQANCWGRETPNGLTQCIFCTIRVQNG